MKSRVAFTLPALLIAALAVGFSFLPTSPTVHTPVNKELKAVVSSTVHVAKVVPVDTTKKGAVIKIESDTYDFHDIEQGTKAIHDFEIGNSGTDTLVISGTRPSCGCTAAVMGTSRIAPGGTSMLHVTFDANNKPEGPIIKTVTITSNATNGSDRIVKIQGRVVKSKLAHKTMMHLDGVFQGDCAKCHVDKGKGELGARLYEADCAVCHGLKTDSKPAPELASTAMMNHTPKQWKTIIENGIPNTAMPAFHTRNKGPLGDEEIASLIEYMSAFKKAAQQNNTIKSLGPIKTTGAVIKAPAGKGEAAVTPTPSTKN